MSLFTGAGVAIVTPMNADGSVNYEKLAELIEFQIANETDSIIICGTTGEAATLTEAEHMNVIKFCVEKVNHRVPVIAGTGSNCTATAVELSIEAEKVGADGLLTVTPYYNKATQGGLIEYFGAVAKAVNIPIIMYNVPSRTGCNILPATAAKLFNEYDNIVGIKEASGNISQVAELAALTEGKLDIYSGNDDQIVPIMSLGGKGVISVLSNVMPKKSVEICDSFYAGDVTKAREIQLELLPLINALFSEVNPIPVKAAMAAMGWCENYVRLPLTCMEEKNEAKLLEIMKEQNLI